MSASAIADRRPRSKKATWAIVLAVIDVLLGWMLLYFLLSPIVVVLAAFALRDIRRQPLLRGRWAAWIAIVLAILGAVAWTFILAAIYSGAAAGGGLGLD